MSNQPARIAIMLPRFSRYGGVEQFGCRLAEALAARGHSTHFICARQETEAPQGVVVLRTGRPHGPRWLKMLVFAFRAEALRQAGNYDCVISLGKTINQDIMRVGGGPLREFWRRSENAYAEGAARRWKQCKRRFDLANLLTLRMEKRQYGGTKRIVAVSHFVRDLIFAAHPSVDPRRVDVIYNRPDLSRFSPPDEFQRADARRRFGINPDVVAIGLATSNFSLKGVGPMIRALRELPETCSLYIVGGRNHGRYDALAKQIGVESRVRFLGKVDAMPQWYHALDVFALPSFYDACSNAVLEALASGLPTLSSTSNGSSYFLPPENVVANPGDGNELVCVLSRLVSEATDPRGAGARKQFVWPDDLPSGLEAFVSLIEEHIAEKRRSPLDLA